MFIVLLLAKAIVIVKALTINCLAGKIVYEEMTIIRHNNVRFHVVILSDSERSYKSDIQTLHYRQYMIGVQDVQDPSLSLRVTKSGD